MKGVIDIYEKDLREKFEDFKINPIFHKISYKN